MFIEKLKRTWELNGHIVNCLLVGNMLQLVFCRRISTQLLQRKLKIFTLLKTSHISHRNITHKKFPEELIQKQNRYFFWANNFTHHSLLKINLWMTLTSILISKKTNFVSVSTLLNGQKLDMCKHYFLP